MKRAILCLSIILASAFAVAAQQPVPPQQGPAAEKLTPKSVDELQKSKADVSWEKIKNLQLQFSQLQGNYQSQLKDLQTKYAEQQKSLDAYKEQVCKDNGWDPKTVNYDAESGQWSKIPSPSKEPEKPVAKK